MQFDKVTVFVLEPEPNAEVPEDVKEILAEKGCLEEQDGVHPAWYEQARKVVYERADGQEGETLQEFMKRVVDGYHHGYGTVCHAIAACALAAAWAANRMEGARGGITGFQSGAVMWEWIQHWQSWEGEPLKLVRYEDMLYPQYAHKFVNVISSETWKWLRERAAARLAENPRSELVHPDVRRHWESIVAGVVPFGYTVKEDET